MWKTLLAGTAALTIVAAGTVAVAQPFGNRPETFRRGPPSAADLQAYADARLAALKAGLGLTDQQAAHWPAFEQAARALQKLRIDRMTAQARQRNNPPAGPVDPAQRLRQRGNTMADMGVALEKLGEALDPLYKSLDENQKRRFAALSRLGGPRGFAMGRRDGDRRGFRGWRDERDFRGERRDFRDGPRGPRGRGGAPDEYPR